jgi:pseudaminic acid biosynthesis-associated methylase
MSLAEIWRGDFGNEYTDRNTATDGQYSRVRLWSEILSHTEAKPPNTILEVGANLGINLRALKKLTPARLLAVEPNDKARATLGREGVVHPSDTRGGTAYQITFPDGAADLVFTSGVLIHIPPEELDRSMSEIHRCAGRWIVCIEYFSDKPEMIPYRGRDGMLFKRDFGSLWMDSHPDLRPVACGFAWKRLTGLDNLTWWLFEKGL